MKQLTNRVYVGFRIPEPDRDLDQASETCVLVINTFEDSDLGWQAEPPTKLRHICGERSARAEHFRKKYGCHSPDGFNWGYAGSGPAELALMILIDLGLTQQDAWLLHQEFKADKIARLPALGPWQLSEWDIRRWIQRQSNLAANRETYANYPTDKD